MLSHTLYIHNPTWIWLKFGRGEVKLLCQPPNLSGQKRLLKSKRISVLSWVMVKKGRSKRDVFWGRKSIPVTNAALLRAVESDRGANNLLESAFYTVFAQPSSHIGIDNIQQDQMSKATTVILHACWDNAMFKMVPARRKLARALNPSLVTTRTCPIGQRPKDLHRMGKWAAMSRSADGIDRMYGCYQAVCV